MSDRAVHAGERWARVIGAAAVFVIVTVLVVASQRGRLDPSRPPTAAPPVPAALLRYREAGRLVTGLKAARGLAITRHGDVLVAAGTVVHRYDGNGVQRLALSGVETSCITESDGMVLAGQGDHVAVLANGATPRPWRAAHPRSVITSIARAVHDVWVADAGMRVVYRYDPSGKLLGRVGEKSPARGIPGLVAPSPYLDLAVANDGTLWVANPGRHRLERYARDGRLLGAWGKAGMDLAGFSGCCNPVNFALLDDGRIVTAEKGLKRVKVYRADGTLDAVVAGPEAFTARGALDVAVDAQGAIYVLDAGDGTVHCFTPKATRDE